MKLSHLSLSVALALSSSQVWAVFATSTSPNLVTLDSSQWKTSTDCLTSGSAPSSLGISDNLYLCGGTFTYSSDSTLAVFLDGNPFGGTIGTLTIASHTSFSTMTINSGVTLNATKINKIAIYNGNSLIVNGTLTLGTGAAASLENDRGTLTFATGTTIPNFAQWGGSGTTLGTSTITGNLTLGGAAPGTLTLSTINTIGGDITYNATNILDIAGTLKFSGATTHTITNNSGSTRTIPTLDLSGMLGGSLNIVTRAITFTNITGGKLTCGTSVYISGPATIPAPSTCSVSANVVIPASIDLKDNTKITARSEEIILK